MATGKVTPTSGGVAEVGNLLQMLGGTKGTTTTTQNAGDVASLQALISQLQGADYNAQLQAIFQQAAGAIPGLQSAYGRAAGARSGNNTAVQAALNELLKATTIEAQSKIANQQLQNQQVQAQAGQAVAQATKGTTQTQTAKEGTNIPRAATNLAMLEALARLSSNKTLTDTIGKLTGGIIGTTPATPAAAPATSVTPQAAAPIASAPAMQPTAAPQSVAAQPMAPVQAVQAPMQAPVMMAPAPVYTPPEVFTPVFAEDFGYVPTPAPEFAPIFAEDFGFEG